MAHKGQCNKNGLLQTKKIGCKQKDRMQTKKTGYKQKRSDANKTKTCHDASSSLGQLTTSYKTSNYDPEVVMDLADGPNWPCLDEI